MTILIVDDEKLIREVFGIAFCQEKVIVSIESETWRGGTRALSSPE